MEELLNAPSQPTRFFSQDPRGNHKRKAGRYMVAYARGFYGELGDVPQRMVAHAQAHDLRFDGPVYITYLLEEICTLDKDQYLAQAIVHLTEP